MLLKLNIAKDDSHITRMLNPYTESPFTFEGYTYLTFESFIQSLKFSNPEQRKEVAQMTSYQAAMKGKKLTKTLLANPVVYTDEEIIQVGSDEYFDYICQALFEKVSQDRQFKLALKLSKNYSLYFDNGYGEPKFSILTKEQYIRCLETVREFILQHE